MNELLDFVEAQILRLQLMELVKQILEVLSELQLALLTVLLEAVILRLVHGLFCRTQGQRQNVLGIIHLFFLNYLFVYFFI